MAALEALERELDELRDRAPSLADSALANAARVLAEMLDDPANSATSRSLCAARLIDALDRLHEMAPPEKQEDRLDELAKRRERRIGRAKAAD